MQTISDTINHLNLGEATVFDGLRLKRSGERHSDQSEVWDDIAACSMDLDVASSTSSMSDIYESYEQRLDGYRDMSSDVIDRSILLNSARLCAL